MKNKLILGLVIATLAFTAIGCGTKNSQTPGNQKENTETETTNNSQNETPKDTSDENNSENESTAEALPFEGIYWYMYEDFFGPDYTEGRYFDGENAYFYGTGEIIAEGVYQYKFKRVEEIEIFTVYFIDLYSDGELIGEYGVQMSEGKLILSLYYEEFGGGYFDCKPVDSFDGLFDKSETTPPSDEATDSLPFEGIYWYVEEEGFDDPEFAMPDVKEGRYYDGTNAYYYYDYASEPTVYQYKYVSTETSGSSTKYYIELYQDGSQVNSDCIEMENGQIIMILDFGGFGGIYQFEKVDSLDGFYE